MAMAVLVAPMRATSSLAFLATRLLVVVLLLLLFCSNSRVGASMPAPAPHMNTPFDAPSPAAPAPGVEEAIIKRSSQTCQGVCGSYA